MSYDLQIWTVDEPLLSDILLRSAGWEAHENQWLYHQGTWAVSVGRPARALPEDMPEDVYSALEGTGYVTELQLSPISASATARRFTLETAGVIVKRAHGLILDQQIGAVILPTGVIRPMSRGSDEEASLIMFSWWFTEGPLSENRYGVLLDVFEAELREALPRRYGKNGPPQYLYAEKGRTDFLAFLNENVQGLGWCGLISNASGYRRIPAHTRNHWRFRSSGALNHR